MSSILEYASPREVECNTAGLLKAILICWLVPLIAGLSILPGWMVSGSEIFPILGLLCICVGTLMAGTGGVLANIILVRELRAGVRVGASLVKFFGLIALLLSNFGAAWVCILAATRLHPM